MKTISSLLLLLFTLSSCNPQGEPPISTPDDGVSTPTPNPNPNPNPDPNPSNPDPDPGTDPGTNPGNTPQPNPQTYKPLGVGGGGAMSGVAISPYSNLWFVGTDMGTLFRSTDLGLSWLPVNHLQAVFNSDLPRAVSPGFSSDGETVFHASRGITPKRSLDGGLTFSAISMNLSSGEYIKYWHSHSSNEDFIYSGTNKGLLVSENKGVSWTRASGITEETLGSFIDYSTNTFYQATANGIWKSTNNAKTFTKVFTPSGIKIRQFTGGRDSNGVTFSFSDNNGTSACGWANAYLSDWGQTSINNTMNTCGYVWTADASLNFTRTSQVVGDHLKMAENDSRTIYVTGGKSWIRQYGTKVHVSKDKGATWNLKLHQMNWDVTPFAAWPREKLEYSAVALDVGWYDDGYESFEINRRDSKIAAGSGYFFIHSTLNTGDNWKAPFTEYADTGTSAAKKKWKTRGIEVISVYRIKYHPRNSDLLYAATADIGGLVSIDGGKSFRISQARYNSNYDYAFDSLDQNVVYAASGASHDWPNDWHANSIVSEGGIFKSSNKGLSWTRLTPTTNGFNRQFLSVGYDSLHGTLYGGSHGGGIARSLDNGATWSFFNTGLPSGEKIIPQIEVDPHTGNVYALLTGDAPSFTNQAATGIYFLDVARGSSTWTLLRGNVNYPSGADAGYRVWFYPTAFAIDFNSPNTIWMTDYENNKNWLMTGVWKSTDRGQNWTRVLQLTHATDIKIDPTDPNKVHAAGYYTLDGSWGKGGQYSSRDGGATWTKNAVPTLQQNSRSILIHPEDPSKLIYSYFGGGMLTGPNPTYN